MNRMLEISKITFNQDTLNWFAAHSGDWNPIHVDSVSARRSIAGEVISHGMLTLIWALDRYCAFSSIAPAKVTVSFLRPVPLGNLITLFIEKDSASGTLLHARTEDEAVITLLLEGTCVISNVAIPYLGIPPQSTSRLLHFDELKGLTGSEILYADSQQIEYFFPNLVRLVGLLPVVSIMASSRIVGMKCPGLHSLFSRAEFEFLPGLQSKSLDWEVVRHTVAQAPIRIEIEGGGLRGRLEAFVRPAPVAQPNISDLIPHIDRHLCNAQVSWIIGGGRGLGELMAKMISVGGGDVVITYNKGREDAERVANEINLFGGNCQILELDVMNPESVSYTLQNVKAPTHMYYFASPRISRPRRSIFNPGLLQEFVKIYVNGFVDIVELLQKYAIGSLKIFYPSTVFINELPKEFPEYIAAKAAGEMVCRHLSKNLNHVDIMVTRLPRLLTDQTSGLIKVSMSDAITELLPVLREMSANQAREDVDER